MADVLITEYVNRGLRDALAKTDILSKLAAIGVLASVCVANNTDVANIQNAFATEINRRQTLPLNQRHGPR